MRTRIRRIALLVLGLLALGAAAAKAAEWLRVAYVNDGDTVVLADRRRVRYIGIDAPEINHEEHTAQPFGLEARQKNAALVSAAGRIRLEYDAERFDSYHRTLAYIFLPDGSMVNAELLRLGLATCLPRAPNLRYEERLLAAQREAMREKRGLWSRFRETGERLVGNRNSKRFHLASCPAVKTIHPTNRVPFATRWEAYWAGYAPSKECITPMTEKK
jgi:micrococcal nuclease